MAYSFVPVCNNAQESHKKGYITIFSFFFSVIFAAPWFVEIQKVCYHDNVT